MRALLEGQTDKHRSSVTSGLMGWRAVFDGRYKLIKGYDPSRKRAQQVPDTTLLFDVLADPKENKNLAHEAPAEVKRLGTLLPEKMRG